MKKQKQQQQQKRKTEEQRPEKAPKGKSIEVHLIVEE
jgi:hypothetical protein